MASPMAKHHWFLLSDHKLSFYTKKCVAGSSWEKMKTLWGQIIIAWPCLVSQFSCVRKWHHHFFCYLNSSLYVVWSMFSADEEGFWVSKIIVCKETWMCMVIYEGYNSWNLVLLRRWYKLSFLWREDFQGKIWRGSTISNNIIRMTIHG